MKFCSKCGKQVNNDAKVCENCGFVFENHDIRKSMIEIDYIKIWYSSLIFGTLLIVSCGILGGCFMILIGANPPEFFNSFIAVPFILGVIVGGLFGAIIHINYKSMEDQSDEIRKKILKSSEIIVDGAAVMKGSGKMIGWLFVTNDSIEYYGPKFVEYFSWDDTEIQSICQENKNLVIVANNEKMILNVSSVDLWLKKIKNFY